MPHFFFIIRMYHVSKVYRVDKDLKDIRLIDE